MRYNKTEVKFTSHYILKCFFRQFTINDNDVSAGKSNTKCHSIYLCRYSLRFENLRRGNRLFEVNLKWDNQLQKYLRHCTVFWHKWPVHDLVLAIPPPPLIKVASNTRPYSKLKGTTLNLEGGGRREVSIIFYRPVTKSDLKRERSFFRESVSSFLQLVVACTSPQAISTSPKPFLISRIVYNPSVIWISPKKQHLLVRQVKNKNH